MPWTRKLNNDDILWGLRRLLNNDLLYVPEIAIIWPHQASQSFGKNSGVREAGGDQCGGGHRVLKILWTQGAMRQQDWQPVENRLGNQSRVV